MSHLIGTTTATEPNAKSIAVPKPFNTRNGHVLFVWIVSNNQTVTAPSGWTKFQDNNIDVFRVQQFYKSANAFEPQSYNFVVTNNAPLVAVMTAWDGIDRTTPVGPNEHPGQVALNHSEPFTTPSLPVSDTLTGGRLLYIRACRRVDSTPITFSHTNSGIPGDQSATELADLGVFSGGNVSYSMCLFAEDTDFTTSSSHSGLPITADPGNADTHNVVSTIAMTLAAAIPPPCDSFYQRQATDGTATLLTGETLTVISDGEVGDPVMGGGFAVHQQFDFETDPSDGDYVVIYSKPFEDQGSGRNGWITRIRATADMTDVGLTTYAILMACNPIVSA